MKKLILGLALLTTSAMAATPASMIFNEVYLKKGTSTEMGFQLIVNRDMKTWCMGYGSQLSVASLEVAEKIDGLQDGLYKCEGKFVQIRAEHTTPIQAFEMGTCSEINPAELKAECPPKK